MATAFLSKDGWISGAAFSKEKIVAHGGVLDGEAIDKDIVHKVRGTQLRDGLAERNDGGEAASASRKQLKLSRQAAQPEERPLGLKELSWIGLEHHDAHGKPARRGLRLSGGEDGTMTAMDAVEISDCQRGSP